MIMSKTDNAPECRELQDSELELVSAGAENDPKILQALSELFSNIIKANMENYNKLAGQKF